MSSSMKEGAASPAAVPLAEDITRSEPDRFTDGVEAATTTSKPAEPRGRAANTQELCSPCSTDRLCSGSPSRSTAAKTQRHARSNQSSALPAGRPSRRKKRTHSGPHRRPIPPRRRSRRRCHRHRHHRRRRRCAATTATAQGQPSLNPARIMKQFVPRPLRRRPNRPANTHTRDTSAPVSTPNASEHNHAGNDNYKGLKKRTCAAPAS